MWQRGLMHRPLAVAGGLLLTTAVAAGCSAPTPTANDVIDAAQDVRNSSEHPMLVPPQPGKGTAALPEFVPDGPYSITVRCLGDASVGMTIDDEAVPPENCSDGMRGVGREARGGPVDVSITAPDDVYWVAGVVQCEALENGVAC